MQTADHELSDSEIEERFGGLFREFREALDLDPLLLVQMVERIADNRRVMAEKAERRAGRRDAGTLPAQAPRRFIGEERAALWAEIASLFGSGLLTRSEIASALGVSTSTVTRALKDADTPA